ncbi:MAG: YraN family protein [Candidatus Pacebacteria bacterium]|nr:YraN family protein [Candidatus Paceibacterota bacterium]
MTKTYKRKIGDYGEELASKFLKRKGLKIQDRNYLKKWGEIDIIAVKKKGFLWREIEKLHFIEVKTVSCETRQGTNKEIIDDYLLSDNIHGWKLQRLKRVFQTYLRDEDVSDETNWQFDIIIVFINLKDISIKDTNKQYSGKNYYIEYIEDVIV